MSWRLDGFENLDAEAGEGGVGFLDLADDLG